MSLDDLILQFSLGVIAFGSNLLSAFAGGGAGLVQLPALVFLGLPFAKALATHKLASVALGIGACWRHTRERKLNSKLVMNILIFGLPGVWIGANMILLIPNQYATMALGILTSLLGIYSVISPELGIKQLSVGFTKYRLIIGAFVLFLIGVLNGSLSSGTGLFVTIWLVRWYGLSYVRAIGYTLVLVGLFWNGTGALVLGLGGEVKFSWLPMLVGGAFIGGYIGADLSISKGSTLVKKSFEILSVLMGGSLIIRSVVHWT